MSDFVPRDILPDLWQEILQRHWSFLETEECTQKLEERKKLEGCLKEFLCVVPHDRKFFLPETGHILRKSVRELTEFTAQNAIVGFETISQYANNLFTKPWRKEYRILKTYSGCYQHDVLSRLLDADQLFLAMGYRRISDDTFVLEGPICPDQVTNVSRDAMAAYVECQIMKHIYAGVQAEGFPCSWKEIFQYRERHIGGTTQSIKEIVYHLNEKRLHKEKLSENTYSNVQTQAQQQPTKGGRAAAASASPCALHGNNLAHPGSSHNCAMHSPNVSDSMSGKYLPPYPAPPSQQQQHHQQTAGGGLMTHSRSLEHYQEPQNVLPHRHSFDQQCQAMHQHPHPHPHVYEAPYDCLDGLSMGSSASYAAVAGGYNAPGNRYPLPYNISNQLNAQYATPADVFTNPEHNMYATIEKTGAPASGPMHSCDYHRRPGHPPGPMQHRQSTYPPDHHLIDFDERAHLTQHDFGAHDYDPRMYEHRGHGGHLCGNAAIYAQPPDPTSYGGYDLPTTLPHSQPQPPPHTAQDRYVYARPVPKNSRTRPLAETDLMQDPMDNNRKMHKELKERASRTAPADGYHSSSSRRQPVNDPDIPTTVADMTAGYETASLDDFVTVSSASPPLMPKVQEGVGSFESWNYVFKNLERSGYSKDLGDREDLLVQSLDLDSLTISNGSANPAEKTTRRDTAKTQPATRAASAAVAEVSGGKGTRFSAAAAETSGGGKARTLEKKTGAIRREAKVVQAPAPSLVPNSSSTGLKKVKSALKTATIDNRGSGSRNRTGAVPKQPPPVSTQLIVTSPNEWSCRFCTFLNPDTKRICEMCCRSKDFNLEAATAASSTAAAAASSVSHASSTCV
ncbi:protein tamozhennic [Drosophila subobscura]|uniref:protein tamozhennic n=1 Tax=Drosophila subobscura TaxID=7241 RepID=UPI00155A2CE5|nr:protein tamozhennic [Drosophila subobscura]